LIEDGPQPDLAAVILAAEQRCHDLSAIAQAEQIRFGASHNETLRRRLLLLEGCEQWARELGQISLESVRLRDPELVRSARETAARIDTTLANLISRVADQISIPPLGEEPADDLGQNLRDEPPHRAVRLLLRIDAALVHLASR
jgi:hypothetical protein